MLNEKIINMQLDLSKFSKENMTLEIIDVGNQKEKVLFRTTTIIELQKCLYRAKYLLNKNGNENTNFEEVKYAVIGALIHELVEYLLFQDRFNLFAVGLQYIDNVYYHLVSNLSKKYKLNLMQEFDQKKIVNTAIIAAAYLSREFNITDTEKVIIIEEDNFVLKITPDILTDQYIIDLKTKFKQLPSNVSYEHAFQLNIYKHYLGLEPLLFYILIDNQTYKLLKPGSFDNIPERLNSLAQKVINREYEYMTIQDIKDPKICLLCRFKQQCDLYKNYISNHLTNKKTKT